MGKRLSVWFTTVLAVGGLLTAASDAAAQQFVFTTCGGAGAFGPTQTMCDAAYGETTLDGAVSVENGIQHWTVPFSGVYRITATGAQGASGQLGRQGGRGARMTGEFLLIAGTTVRVVVGQVGQMNNRGGSGGGGSFVVEATEQLLIAAGGGGGTRTFAGQDGCDASITTFGVIGSGMLATSTCAAKTTDNGLGGQLSHVTWGSGGAGFFGNGADDTPWGSGGRSWANGMQGGSAGTGCSAPVVQGGFGGGGTGDGCVGGGGGGGYSGGDGGFIAGGGGSFNIGANPDAVAGVGVGDGGVALELLAVDVTPPAISLDVVPPSLTNSASAEFAFSANEPAIFHCQLDGGVEVACNTAADQGGITFDGLSDGPHTFTVTATDAGFNSSKAQYSWTADTQAPSLVSVDALPNPSLVNTAIALRAVWSGAATASYSLNGGALIDMALNGDTFTADLGAFTAAGVHDICVRASDAAGNSTGAECLLLAVYDPSAGFATGGGWISSPAGALKDDPAAVGKASFGFVAKYQKGAGVPTGVVEFQFQVGDLNFHSSTFDWMVISGSKVQVKGTGTINGTGSFSFHVTATDGSVEGAGSDQLRMRITNQATGALVYDNQANTIIGGGNVVIHKPTGKQTTTAAKIVHSR